MGRLAAVLHHLDRLRKGYVRSRALLFAVGTLTCLWALATAFVLIDLLLHIPDAGCWACWLLAVSLIGLGGYVVVRTVRQRVTHAATAILVEKVLPHVDNHLVNAVQLSEGTPGSEAFVEEVLSEIDVGLEVVRPRHLYSQAPLRWVRRGLAGVAVLFLAALALSPRGTARSLLRLSVPMLGLEPYTLTRIVEVTPGHVTVLRGGSLDVAATFAGVLAKDARVVWDLDRGKVEDLPMLTPEDLGREARAAPGTEFYCRLKGVFYESRYRVVAGDASSPWFTITVTNPPGLERWEARVSPPDYMGMETFSLDGSSSTMEVPEGSRLALSGVASCDLREVRVTQDEEELAAKETDGRRRFAVVFAMQDGGPVRVRVKASSSLEAEELLPFVVLLDQAPSVTLVEGKQRILAAKDAQVPIAFQVEDDYGVRAVGLERLLGEGRAEDVATAGPEVAQRHFQGRFVVDLPTFGVAPGDTLRFRVWAEDLGPETRQGKRRRGVSGALEISIPAPDEQREAKKQVAHRSKEALLELIKMQRDSLRNTRRLSDIVTMEQAVTGTQIQEIEAAQRTIRDMAGDLLQAREALGDLSAVVSGLVNHEMAEVLVVLQEAHRAVGKQLTEKLQAAVALETRILAALTGIPANLTQEARHQEKVDLLGRLQKLVAGQMTNLKESKAAQRGEPARETTDLLAKAEDQLASDLIVFTDHCSVMLEQRVEDEFAKQIRRVYDLVDGEEVYEKMLSAAEALEDMDFAVGVQSQEEALRTLMDALDILNRWRMQNAKKITEAASDALKEVAEKLGELEEKQAKIAEVTRDLASRGKLDDDVRKQLADMDKEQEEMADVLEELAQDLYQFPELPICNELNSKMREIFEDVEQALDSENAPAIEIAVQKEDSLLDAIRNTKERVEDVEMWLPDIPDNIVWNMESFDTDEFPEIPLVPLPDELEDIVGELLDQAESIAQQSQDTTGNNIIADMEMGWAVMDGPMPCFSAKGKSGNMRPNDNEMTGRSGAGREGQSNGELVENHVKGLEGTKTHARRTQEPFQKGQVTEDEDSTMDAKATGGGKLGGESETMGMFGKAPRRDLHVGDHGPNPTKLRQETEALYATARLLYLGTGSLGTAARELRGLETKRRDMGTFDSLHRKVLRRLEDTQMELANGVVLPMPVASVSKTGGAATQDVDVSQISEEYRDIVTDYYRSLDAD